MDGIGQDHESNAQKYPVSGHRRTTGDNHGGAESDARTRDQTNRWQMVPSEQSDLLLIGLLAQHAVEEVTGKVHRAEENQDGRESIPAVIAVRNGGTGWNLTCRISLSERDGDRHESPRSQYSG